MRISYFMMSVPKAKGVYRYLRPTDFRAIVLIHQKSEKGNTVAYGPPKNVFSLIPLSIKCSKM